MTVRNRKIAIVAIIALLMVLAITVYRRNQERIPQFMIDMSKFHYASVLEFNFRIVIHGRAFDLHRFVVEYIHPQSRHFDPSFNELVFVHNEAESLDFPDNVIVAWPNEDTVEGLIAGIHWAVNRQEADLIAPGYSRTLRRPVVTLEEFGFIYPLTIENLVDDWEEFNVLWQAFDHAEQGFIIGAAPHGGPRVE